MKKILLLCCTLFAATICLAAKEVKITVIISDAKIYLDGNYAADGITTATLKKKDGFIVVKFEREGYVTLETKIFTTDKRKAVSYTMRRDAFFDVSVASGLVNKYFSVKISKDLYTVDESGKRNTELALKMMKFRQRIWHRGLFKPLGSISHFPKRINKFALVFPSKKAILVAI